METSNDFTVGPPCQTPPVINPLLVDHAKMSDADLVKAVFGHRRQRLREQISSAVDGVGLLTMTSLDPIALMTIADLPPAMAARFTAIVELARRLAVGSRPARVSLMNPEEVCAVMAPTLAAISHEEFWCLPLDSRKQLIGYPRIVSRGDVDGTDAGTRTFTRQALLAHATSAIAVHNHPTGDPAPSPSDHAVTVRLVSAGRSVDVPLLDHVIIGDGGRFVSLRRNAPELFR
jgi:DNA repair protein RadC